MWFGPEPEDTSGPCIILCIGLTFPPTTTAHGPFNGLEEAQKWWDRTKSFHDLDDSVHVVCSLEKPVVPTFGGQPIPSDPSRN
jgi:hypothetical protein